MEETAKDEDAADVVVSDLMDSEPSKSNPFFGSLKALEANGDDDMEEAHLLMLGL